MGLTRPSRDGGGQDSASMDWPWAARPPPRSGVGATPAGGASQGLLLGLQGRRGRGGGQGAGRVPPLSYLHDGPAALGRTLPWLRNPVPLPVSHIWFYGGLGHTPELAGPQDPSPAQ